MDFSGSKHVQHETVFDQRLGVDSIVFGRPRGCHTATFRGVHELGLGSIDDATILRRAFDASHSVALKLVLGATNRRRSGEILNHGRGRAETRLVLA